MCTHNCCKYVIQVKPKPVMAAVGKNQLIIIHKIKMAINNHCSEDSPHCLYQGCNMGGQCFPCLYYTHSRIISGRRDTPHRHLINADRRVSWLTYKSLLEKPDYLKPLVLSYNVFWYLTYTMPLAIIFHIIDFQYTSMTIKIS